MDNSTPDILVQYLDGELSGTAKHNLEQQLSNDTLLKAQLGSLRKTKEVIRLYALQQKIAGLHSQMMDELEPVVKKMPSTNSRKKIIRYSLAAAASVVLLIGAYFFFNRGNPTAEKLFASNYHTYELMTLRNANDTVTKMEKAYREKNYREVLRIHDAGEDHTPKGEFLCGAASLEINNLPKAIRCFSEVLDASRQTGQPILKDEAEYYLSLSYIRNQDFDEAIILLNNIENDPGHKYSDQVDDKLIRQVERLQQK